MRVKKMITNLRSSQYLAIPPCQYHGKCTKNSMENMQPDVKVLRESWIVIGNPSVTDLEFNPLTSTSDQNRPSPYNIITLSSRKVTRIRKTINQGFADPITLARDCKNKTVFH